MLFYYFLPRITKEQLAQGELLNRDLLATAGLVAVPGQSQAPGPLEDVRKVPAHASLCEIHNSKGPGNQSGTLLVPVSKLRGSPPNVSDCSRLLWRPVGDGSKAWIGVPKTETPKPQDLERWQTIGGYTVADNSGSEWLVPVGRAPQEGFQYGTLPQSYAFDASGEPQGHLDPAYEWLWKLAGEVRDYYVRCAPLDDEASPAEKAAHTPPSFQWLIKQAAKILAVNYRVGPHELTFLHELGRGVLTQLTIHSIARACFGYEILEEAKKKPPAGTADDSGPPAPN